MYGVFWDELKYSKMDKQDTCYLDMCNPHPCHPDSGCINTWDGEQAGYECEFGKLDSFQRSNHYFHSYHLYMPGLAAYIIGYTYLYRDI